MHQLTFGPKWFSQLNRVWLNKDLKSLSLTSDAKLAQRREHQTGRQEVPISILTGGTFFADFLLPLVPSRNCTHVWLLRNFIKVRYEKIFLVLLWKENSNWTLKKWESLPHSWIQMSALTPHVSKDLVFYTNEFPPVKHIHSPIIYFLHLMQIHLDS